MTERRRAVPAPAQARLHVQAYDPPQDEPLQEEKLLVQVPEPLPKE